MTWRISLILSFVFLSSCYQEKETEKIVSSDTVVDLKVIESYLIEADELKKMAMQPHVSIVDFRKNENYKKEHILDAVNVWRTDIEDPTYDYGGMMATKNQIESLFSKLGIGTDDTIVIYDDNGLCNASRLWWILQNYDFDNVKMLQGGISAWKAIGGKVSNEIPTVIEMEFTLAENTGMKYYLSKEEMQKASASHITILDTRTTDEFTGKRQKDGAAKGGRIPHSVHIDWADAINYNGDQRLKSIEELEKVYNKLNIEKTDPIMVYCHSGVRSAHTTFVLTQLLGYENVKNYDGSWVEWSHDDDLPYEFDTKTLIQ